MQLPLKSPHVYPSQQPVEHPSPATPQAVGVGVGVGAAQRKVAGSQFPEQHPLLIKQVPPIGPQGKGDGDGDGFCAHNPDEGSTYPEQHGAKGGKPLVAQGGVGVGVGVAKGLETHG
jgi:hypothetical protein